MELELDWKLKKKKQITRMYFSVIFEAAEIYIEILQTRV
jgi:hypothetical protein